MSLAQLFDPGAVLESVRRAPTLLKGLEQIETLIGAARTDGADALDLLQDAVADQSDQLTSIGAVHAAAAGGIETATAIVVPLLRSSFPFLREHAAWALATSPPIPSAMSTLEELVAEGGFTGTLAEATLEAWEPTPIHESGQLPSAGADNGLRRQAADGAGFTVAQLFLHADIDGSLSHAGQGDTGGIATLLVQLGDALLSDGTVDRVLTLSRRRIAADQQPSGFREPGHHYPSVPLPGSPVHAADAWHLRRAAQSALRRILRECGPIHALHLRMADVGSWAAAQVARDLGIPIVVTVAPDPHALIAARESAGALTRANFGSVDHSEHLMFRVRLLRNLVDQAAHLVAFPRTDLERDLRELLHIVPGAGTAPVSVVPEGIDLAPLRRADQEVRSSLQGAPVTASVAAELSALDAVLATLPPERRHLPVAISVGRLHRVKGMATLVEAWASDADLSGRCNLLIVGGDLHQPTDDEAEQLARIDALIPRADGPRRGLLLAGHRPNSTVVAWLAAVRHGRPGLSSPAGVYVSASVKEEFGIAILEAMASGLVVAAPIEGGPATYVEHGVTGVLVATDSPVALGAGLAHALDLAAAPDADLHAHRAQAMVAERFSIATMASTLAEIYAAVHSEVSQ